MAKRTATRGRAISRRLVLAAVGVLTLVVLAAVVVVADGRRDDAPDGAPTEGGRRTAVADLPARGGIEQAGAATALGPATGHEVDERPVAVAWRDAPVPTNQWWTSLATDRPSRVWMHPLAVEVRDIGTDIAAPEPEVSADEIVDDWRPFWRVHTTGAPSVIGYGDFSVTVSLRTTGGGTLTTTLAQGLPAVGMRATAGTVEIEMLAPPDDLRADDGTVLSIGSTITTARLVARAGGERWDVHTDHAVTWTRTALTLAATSAEPFVITLARPPADDVPGWSALVAELTRHPVTSTTAVARVVDGAVQQTLRWERDIDAPTPVVLLPHQLATIAEQPTALGTYPGERGPLTLVAARDVRLVVPVPGLVTRPVPVDPTGVDLSPLVALDERTEVRPGSYFGGVDLGRLATAVDGLDAFGPPAALVPARDRLVARLATELVDRFTYDGAGDDRWLADEPVWGGLVAIPPEFNSDNHSDRHFHLGYVFVAAAVVAEHGTIDEDVAKTVDLLAASLLAAGVPTVASVSASRDGTVPLGSGGIFSPWAGHSYADGYAQTNRGNNQESSSEAVNAWYGIARWAQATGRSALADAAIVRYALESASARTYWLGEGTVFPSGYAHETAGIIWDDRVEHRTFFSADPETVIGIQLLPYTYGSLYRSDAAAAQRRSGDLLRVGGTWPDVLVLDVALADPERARQALADLVAQIAAGRPVAAQTGVSLTFAAAWIAMRAQLGLPDDTAVLSPPYGRVFRTADGRRTVVATNASAQRLTVLAQVDGRKVTVQVPGRGATSRAIS